MLQTLQDCPGKEYANKQSQMPEPGVLVLGSWP